MTAGCTTSTFPTLSTYLNWKKGLLPITTTLGAGGGKQQDIDGDFCTWLHFVLVWRPEDCTFQHLNQHSNLLHGSFLTHVSGICHYIWGQGGPVLPEGYSPLSSWMHTFEKGCQDHNWGICGWRGFPSWQQVKVNWWQGQQRWQDDSHINRTQSFWQDGRPWQVYPPWAPHLQSVASLMSLSTVDPSLLIHCHHLLWMKRLPLPPLITKPNWCNGTTVCAISFSINWSSSPSMARYPRNCQSSSPPQCAGWLFGVMTKLPWRGK